jgi:hypothetical protein
MKSTWVCVCGRVPPADKKRKEDHRSSFLDDRQWARWGYVLIPSMAWATTLRRTRRRTFRATLRRTRLTLRTARRTFRTTLRRTRLTLRVARRTLRRTFLFALAFFLAAMRFPSFRVPATVCRRSVGNKSSRTLESVSTIICIFRHRHRDCRHHPAITTTQFEMLGAWSSVPSRGAAVHFALHGVPGSRHDR